MLWGCRVVVGSWACRWGRSPGSGGRCSGLSAGCGGGGVVAGAVAVVVSAVPGVVEHFACAESVAVVVDAAGRVVGRPARLGLCVHPGDMDGACGVGRGNGPFGAGR